MILHEIDGKPTCIEPTKNKTEGKMISAQRWELDIMRDQGIVPNHQILKKTILAAYRKEIRANHMTFQIVPPEDYFRKLADKAIHTRKDSFI